MNRSPSTSPDSTHRTNLYQLQDTVEQAPKKALLAITWPGPSSDDVPSTSSNNYTAITPTESSPTRRVALSILTEVIDEDMPVSPSLSRARNRRPDNRTQEDLIAAIEERVESLRKLIADMSPDEQATSEDENSPTSIPGQIEERFEQNDQMLQELSEMSSGEQNLRRVPNLITSFSEQEEKEIGKRYLACIPYVFPRYHSIQEKNFKEEVDNGKADRILALLDKAYQDPKSLEGMAAKKQALAIMNHMMPRARIAGYIIHRGYCAEMALHFSSLTAGFQKEIIDSLIASKSYHTITYLLSRGTDECSKYFILDVCEKMLDAGKKNLVELLAIRLYSPSLSMLLEKCDPDFVDSLRQNHDTISKLIKWCQEENSKSLNLELPWVRADLIAKLSSQCKQKNVRDFAEELLQLDRDSILGLLENWSHKDDSEFVANEIKLDARKVSKLSDLWQQENVRDFAVELSKYDGDSAIKVLQWCRRGSLRDFACELMRLGSEALVKLLDGNESIPPDLAMELPRVGPEFANVLNTCKIIEEVPITGVCRRLIQNGKQEMAKEMALNLQDEWIIKISDWCITELQMTDLAAELLCKIKKGQFVTDLLKVYEVCESGEGADPRAKQIFESPTEEHRLAAVKHFCEIPLRSFVERVTQICADLIGMDEIDMAVSWTPMLEDEHLLTCVEHSAKEAEFYPSIIRFIQALPERFHSTLILNICKKCMRVTGDVDFLSQLIPRLDEQSAIELWDYGMTSFPNLTDQLLCRWKDGEFAKNALDFWTAIYGENKEKSHAAVAALVAMPHQDQPLGAVKLFRQIKLRESSFVGRIAAVCKDLVKIGRIDLTTFWGTMLREQDLVACVVPFIEKGEKDSAIIAFIRNFPDRISLMSKQALCRKFARTITDSLLEELSQGFEKTQIEVLAQILKREGRYSLVTDLLLRQDGALFEPAILNVCGEIVNLAAYDSLLIKLACHLKNPAPRIRIALDAIARKKIETALRCLEDLDSEGLEKELFKIFKALWKEEESERAQELVSQLDPAVLVGVVKDELTSSSGRRDLNAAALLVITSSWPSERVLEICKKLASYGNEIKSIVALIPKLEAVDLGALVQYLFDERERYTIERILQDPAIPAPQEKIFDMCKECVGRGESDLVKVLLKRLQDPYQFLELIQIAIERYAFEQANTIQEKIDFTQLQSELLGLCKQLIEKHEGGLAATWASKLQSDEARLELVRLASEQYAYVASAKLLCQIQDTASCQSEILKTCEKLLLIQKGELIPQLFSKLEETQKAELRQHASESGRLDLLERLLAIPLADLS